MFTWKLAHYVVILIVIFITTFINRQGAGEVQCRCMNYDPDDIDKDSQGFRIYCNDNANKLDTKHCH